MLTSLRHSDSVADVGYMIGGRIGREFLAIAYWLFMTCVAGSGMLGISIALNAISMHGTCTAVFVAVAAILVFGISSIQTLEKLSWISWAGVISITVSREYAFSIDFARLLKSPRSHDRYHRCRSAGSSRCCA